MARLPEHPNFEHLKKQAKDLLRLYQDRDGASYARLRQFLPAAEGLDDAAIAALDLKLHDAQSAIAREYGCGNWQELKNYVDFHNSRHSRARQDVVPLWLNLVYGHDEDGRGPGWRPVCWRSTRIWSRETCFWLVRRAMKQWWRRPSRPIPPA